MKQILCIIVYWESSKGTWAATGKWRLPWENARGKISGHECTWLGHDTRNQGAKLCICPQSPETNPWELALKNNNLNKGCRIHNFADRLGLLQYWTDTTCVTCCNPTVPQLHREMNILFSRGAWLLEHCHLCSMALLYGKASSCLLLNLDMMGAINQRD